jgi:hypothetical protein
MAGEEGRMEKQEKTYSPTRAERVAIGTILDRVATCEQQRAALAEREAELKGELEAIFQEARARLGVQGETLRYDPTRGQFWTVPAAPTRGGPAGETLAPPPSPSPASAPEAQPEAVGGQV